MDGADMESAPTFMNMVWHNDKFMRLNIVDVRIVFCSIAVCRLNDYIILDIDDVGARCIVPLR